MWRLAWCRRQTSCSPTGRCTNMNWKNYAGFRRGNIDVLVSTTIIETGLDIPNANTIIIHDADRLGLSQL